MPILCPHKRTHFFFFKKEKEKEKSRKETGIIFSFLPADLEIKIRQDEANSVISEASLEHLFKTCLQLHVEASSTQML